MPYQKAKKGPPLGFQDAKRNPRRLVETIQGFPIVTVYTMMDSAENNEFRELRLR